jgi:AraC-like DNA-binding protein
MCSMLQRPAVDNDLCRRNYLEAPGDLAHEVRNANLVADPGSTPRGTGLWVSTIDMPLPFHVRSAPGYVAVFNLGEAFHMDLRMAAEKAALSLEPGSTYLQRPGCDLHLTCSGLQTYRLLSFACEASHLETAALSADLTFPAQASAPSWSPKSDPQTLAICQAIVAELRSDQGMPMLLETLTQALAIQVVRRTSGARIEAPRPASGLAPYVLQRVVDYVHEHIQDPLSIDALAAVAGLSTYHFCRMFRRSTGLPPYQYLAQLRIARARESLLQTSEPIGDIAFGAGFGSSSQFSHCFKKLVGCTPQEYRRQGIGA